MIHSRVPGYIADIMCMHKIAGYLNLIDQTGAHVGILGGTRKGDVIDERKMVADGRREIIGVGS